MEKIKQVIENKKVDIKPIWLMRQAGRYLPEFREIRSKNQDFIKLCLNETLVPEITLQPLKRFDLDAAIIFSDILMLHYGLGQSVKFKKDFGPMLGDINDVDLNNVTENSFIKSLEPVYTSMNNLSKSLKGGDKSLIGFVGAPWTILIYMLNRQSPKKKLSSDLHNIDKKKSLSKIITSYLKIHIREQVKSGATVIQIFDSWAGLAAKDDIKSIIYNCSADLVEFTKSLGVPAICFPREIVDYKEYVSEVNPSAVNIDYNVDINYISKNINIPVQGGLDPKFLLSDKETLKSESLKILDIFKDYPYIFNLGHGVLPKTDPNMVDYLVNIVKDY